MFKNKTNPMKVKQFKISKMNNYKDKIKLPNR